ncbi:MAG TPA: PIN domain-containing protein [Chthoniobacterales bacterium]
MVLVDSSIYIGLLREGRNPVLDLEEAFGGANLVGCDVVRCEVLRGVVRPALKTRLGAFFDVLIHVPTDHRVWQATEDLAWQLDRAGKVLPLTDLVIAVCALRAGASVLTSDAHFALIPQLQLASW